MTTPPQPAADPPAPPVQALPIPPQAGPPGGYQVPPGAYRPPAIPVLPVPTSPGGHPLAEFVDRLVARIIDVAILGGISAVIIIPIYIVALVMILPTSTVVNGQSYDPAPEEVMSTIVLPLIGVGIAIVVLTLLIAYIYEVEMMFRTGQTLGKRVMKIRIVALDPAQPLTRGLAVKRWLVVHGASLVPGLNWVDGLWQLWDKPYRQCLHDKFATTVVIKLKP